MHCVADRAPAAAAGVLAGALGADAARAVRAAPGRGRGGRGRGRGVPAGAGAGPGPRAPSHAQAGQRQGLGQLPADRRLTPPRHLIVNTTSI